MRTIAITIDEESLDLIDTMTARRDCSRSRSALIREAIRAYLAHEFRGRVEARERQVIRKNKRLLDRQLRALVKE